jgi:hypothetical protein
MGAPQQRAPGVLDILHAFRGRASLLALLGLLERWLSSLRTLPSPPTRQGPAQDLLAHAAAGDGAARPAGGAGAAAGPRGS